MDRLGMALPLSSSLQSKALASLLSGSININIIGHIFKFFNISGIISSSIRHHRASTYHITILSCCHDIWLAKRWSRTRVRQNVISSGSMTRILTGDDDHQLYLERTLTSSCLAHACNYSVTFMKNCACVIGGYKHRI